MPEKEPETVDLLAIAEHLCAALKERALLPDDAKPCALSPEQVSVWQSREGYAFLRLYVVLIDGKPMAQFGAHFLPEANRPPPQPIASPGMVVMHWEWLMDQYRLMTDFAYLRDRLIAAGMPGALPAVEVAEHRHIAHEQNRIECDAVDAIPGDKRAAHLAAMLRRTADKIERNDWNVVHNAHEETGEFFIKKDLSCLG